MTAISVSERLLEMAAFYTPLALTVTTLWVVEPQVQEIRAIGTVILIGMHLLKLRIKSMQIRVKKR